MSIEPAAKDDPVQAAEKERKELQEILPDIKGKVSYIDYTCIWYKLPRKEGKNYRKSS